jgi:hypothetical protein
MTDECLEPPHTWFTEFSPKFPCGNVLSVPFELRLLLARNPSPLSAVGPIR